MEGKEMNPAEELKNTIDSAIETKATEATDAAVAKSAEALEATKAELTETLTKSATENKEALETIQKQMDELKNNAAPAISKGRVAKSELQEFLMTNKEALNGLKKGEGMTFESKSFGNGQAGQASAIYGDERVSQIKFDPNYKNRLDQFVSGGTTSQTGAIRYSQETTDTVGSGAKTVAGAYNVASGKGTAFAEANKVLTDVHVPIQTMGVFTSVAEEWLDDTAMLESYLSTRLGGDLGDAKDRQILKGAGTGNQFTGINTGGTSITTDGQIGSWADYFAASLDAAAKANNYDVLTGLASRLARLNFTADLAILSPDDFYQLSNIKASTGEYVLTQTMGEGGVVGYFWKGMRVIMSNAQDAGDVTVLDSNATGYWNREGMSIEFGYDSDDFTTNSITVRAKCRGAVTNYRPNGIATGEFSAIKALMNA